MMHEGCEHVLMFDRVVACVCSSTVFDGNSRRLWSAEEEVGNHRWGRHPRCCRACCRSCCWPPVCGCAPLPLGGISVLAGCHGSSSSSSIMLSSCYSPIGLLMSSYWSIWRRFVTSHIRLAISSDLCVHLSGSSVASLYTWALCMRITLRPCLLMFYFPPVVVDVSTRRRPLLYTSLNHTILNV